MVSSLGPEPFHVRDSTVSALPGSGTSGTILDPLKINARRSKLDCPHFDGYNFLVRYMKVEQFFEAIGVAEDKKVQLVMIHLEDKAL